jgi:cell wall-associated NlpC family hydrolase
MILTPDQVALALLQAQRELGVQLTRDEMIGLVEIPSRESGYDTHAHNDSGVRYPKGDPRNTGDDSYGLWQVNMLGQMGVNRSRSLGIKDYSEMFDPVTSAKAAIQLVLAGRKQGDPLHAWGGYKGMSNTYNVSRQADADARAAVDRVGAGVANGGESFLAGLRQGVYGTSGKGASPAATSLVSWLTQQIGKPYIFGSSDAARGGFDCSGLIAAGYRELGINIPAYTFSMKEYGQKVTDYKNLQPGDMLYVHGAQGDFGHVGVYAGNGQVIDAPHTGAFVRETPLTEWLPRIQSVNRIMDGEGRVIVGGGLVPTMRAGVLTVPISQAKATPDMLTPNSGTNDPFAVPGATQPKIIEDRQPFILPGFGRQQLEMA